MESEFAEWDERRTLEKSTASGENHKELSELPLQDATKKERDGMEKGSFDVARRNSFSCLADCVGVQPRVGLQPSRIASKKLKQKGDEKETKRVRTGQH